MEGSLQITEPWTGCVELGCDVLSWKGPYRSQCHRMVVLCWVGLFWEGPYRPQTHGMVVLGWIGLCWKGPYRPQSPGMVVLGWVVLGCAGRVLTDHRAMEWLCWVGRVLTDHRAMEWLRAILFPPHFFTPCISSGSTCFGDEVVRAVLPTTFSLHLQGPGRDEMLSYNTTTVPTAVIRSHSALSTT